MKNKALRLLAFSGSERVGSLNVSLLKIAMEIARSLGADVTHLELKSYQMPLYDPDLEGVHGLPDSVRAVRNLFVTHDAFLIASPEYNSSITPMMKNVLDWVSRSQPEDPRGTMPAFHGKIAILCAASPGSLGGLRGLYGLRFILENVGVNVSPDQLAVPAAHQLLRPDHNVLSDATMQQRLETTIKRGLWMAEQLRVTA